MCSSDVNAVKVSTALENLKEAETSSGAALKEELSDVADESQFVVMELIDWATGREDTWEFNTGRCMDWPGKSFFTHTSYK